MKILVIGNQIVFREKVVDQLKNQPGIKIIGEFDLSHDTAQKILAGKPDIILLDPGCLYTESFNLMKLVLAQQPEVSFVILSTQPSDEQFYEVMRHGARGYLARNDNKLTLLASLRALERGEAALSRNLVTKLLNEFIRLGKLVSDRRADMDINLLTYREIEVLKVLGQHASNRAIAEQLGISENTVRVHVSNILAKLRLRNRREASAFVRRID
jgi:DNA-binding NarL/FixJ family response regulator